MKKYFSLLLVFAFFVISTVGLINVPSKEVQSSGTVYASSVYARGGDLIANINESIYYDHKEVEQSAIWHRLPGYLSSYTCGITSGSIVTGYYNKDYNNLIPNVPAGLTAFNMWVWTTTTNYQTNFNTLWNTLYSDMNATSVGVTIPGYLGGLNTYVNRQGYNFNSSSAMSGNSLNMTAIKSAINNGEILSIFMDGFNVVNASVGLMTYTGYDKLILEHYAGAHIMTVYGYMEVSYFNSQNVPIRKDTYLNVHTGFSGVMALLCVSNYITIDDCYVLSVS